MRLSVGKIKEALLHTDPDVREAAVFYFARSCSADPTIMPLVIQAFERYGLDAFKILSFVHNLVQTDDTVGWLIREIEQVGPGKDEHEVAYIDALLAALRHTDPLVLERHKSTIQGMQQLDDLSKEELAERFRVSSFSADALWRELTEFCQTQDQEEGEITGRDYEFVCSVVQALGRYPDKFANQVLAMLENPEEHGDWLAQMAVRLAGEIKLDAAIPHLVDRLDDCGTWLYEEARWALAKLGTDAVVKELAERCGDNDLESCLTAASLLEDIHTDLSVQMCLEMLGQEEDAEVRGSLLQSVLMNFSSAGIEPARQHVLTTPKSPQMLEVRSALLAACKMMGETFPEFEAWLEDSKHDIEFRRQWYEDHPLSYPANDFDEEEMDDFDDDGATEEDDLDDEVESLTVVRRQPPVGRNDPCPCGSGKKFKKCCYGKVGFAESDEVHSALMSEVPPGRSSTKFPVGTVALYGPDDRTTTKIVAGIIKYEGADPILERWVGSNIKDNPKVQRQMQAFFERHKVKNVVASDGNMGCPHEEGQDFPVGQDCPFCPFWAGKQGSNQPD